MALQKTITTPFGIDATYHVITEQQFNFKTRSSMTYIESYIDKASYDSGNSCLAKYSFEWDNADFPFSESDQKAQNVSTISIAYTKIVQGEDWSDASIVD